MARLVILGGGESGVGAAVLAKVKGFEVFVSENGRLKPEHEMILKEWEIPYEEGGHSSTLILNADEVVKSPGIPRDASIIKALVAQGTSIISEIEFAFRYDKSKKICVTGSNGKTTTASLIHYLFMQSGLNAGLAGNIGKSYAMQVATEQHDYYVLEISSFQLEDCYEFRPDIAIITNISPDHLDRYNNDIRQYAETKFRITRNLRPEDCFIFDSDNAITVENLNNIIMKARMLPFSQSKELKQGAFVKKDSIEIRYERENSTIYLRELALGGKHNLNNSMAAALAAKASGISNEVIKESLKSFQPLEHRMEPVLSVGGVLYINDSKATNVDAAWYALECQHRPVVWITGGTDKGNDYSALQELVSGKVKAIVCLGKDNAKIHEAFEDIVGKDRICDSSSADEAVKKAAYYANSGDVVLLSPCCASFDLFENFEDRGRQFKAAVRRL